MTFEAPRVKDEPAVPEWSKEQRMGDEKDLLGAYFCGHPLDSMRGVIDAEKYTRIGLIDTNSSRSTRLPAWFVPSPPKSARPVENSPF